MSAALRVLVALSSQGGELDPRASGLLATAAELAAQGGAEVEAVVLGPGAEAAALSLRGLKLSSLGSCEHPALEPYTPGAWRDILADFVQQRRADLLLLLHDYRAQELLPALAVELSASLVPEASSARLGADGIEWLRPAWQGKLRVRLRSAAGPAVASIVPDDGEAPRGDGELAVAAWSPEREPRPDREVIEILEPEASVDLRSARRLVAVGRGVGGPEHLGPIRELAAKLGAELAASRPVVDAGWLARDRQVGSSGQSVAPDLYLALGISGALQHLQGISEARCVVAVNQDASAPIFRVARYGLVADLHALVPALERALDERDA